MSKEEDFKGIFKAIMNTYRDQMHDYLNSKPAGSLTDADVVIMIMNLTSAVGTNIYYSLKQYLPTSPLDFDFMKVKLVNSFADSFEAIKSYNPKDGVMPLTVEHLKEIQEKGFVIIKLPDGTERKVTDNDILIKKDVAEKLVKETKEAAHTPKIIVPSNRMVSGGR